MVAPALEVVDLTVTVKLKDGRRVPVVEDVSFEIPSGGSMGLVGESGSGKTMTSLAVMGLLPRIARIEKGRVLLAGEDLVSMSQRQLRRVRGTRIGMILQDPMTALDPCFTIRDQLQEPLRQHQGLEGQELELATVGALQQVHLPATPERLEQYPHHLSGGMRQRVTSAIALAGRPEVLIADEPTTALDVTTQARYLQLLHELQEEFGFALLLVTHDLFIVRHVCSDVTVMYDGQVVEQGPVGPIFSGAMHPYTKALIRAIPDLGDSVTLESIDGQAPDIGEEMAGCSFVPRCPHSRDMCFLDPPALTGRPQSRVARCWGTEPDGWLAW